MTYNLCILKNTVQKEEFFKYKKQIIKNIPLYTILGLKISPMEFTTKPFMYISTKVCNYYSFLSIRGIYFLCIDNPINTLSLMSFLLKDNNVKIYNSNQKNWEIVYLNNFPFLLINCVKKRNRYIYSFYIQGTPNKPLGTNKESLNYTFGMSFPEFDKSFDFNHDYCMTLCKQYIIDYLKNNSINYNYTQIFNVNYKFYKGISFCKSLNAMFKPLVQNKIPFNNTIYDTLVRKSTVYNVNIHKKKLKYINNKFLFKNPSTWTQIAYKNSLYRLIYSVNACKIDSIEKCHNLASNIKNLLSDSYNICSYYQYGFDIDEKTFNKHNTLAYGHNSLIEKEIIPISSIHIFYESKNYTIYIYKTGAFLLIGPVSNTVLLNNKEYSGLDLINLISDYLLKME